MAQELRILGRGHRPSSQYHMGAQLFMIVVPWIQHPLLTSLGTSHIHGAYTYRQIKHASRKSLKMIFNKIEVEHN